MSIRSRLNELFVLCKLIDASVDNESPEVRSLALKAVEAINASTEELAVKIFNFVVKLDQEGGVK